MNKQVKDCDTCKYYKRDARYDEPCKSCIEVDNINGVPLYWRKNEVKDE